MYEEYWNKIIIIMIVWCEKKEGHNDHDQDAMMMIRIILRINMNDAVEGPCLQNWSKWNEVKWDEMR